LLTLASPVGRLSSRICWLLGMVSGSWVLLLKGFSRLK